MQWGCTFIYRSMPYPLRSLDISLIEYFSGPVGYDPELPSVPTLTLSNLIAGKDFQLKTTF